MIGYAQSGSYTEECSVCSPIVEVTASAGNQTVYLQVGRERNKIGEGLSEVLAVQVCKEVLQNKLSALCTNQTYSSSEFINFIRLFSSKAIGALYHPPVLSNPVLTATVELTAPLYLGLINTPKGNFVISLLGQPTPVDIFYRPADTGKYLFNVAAFRDNPTLKANLPGILFLKEKIAGIKFPALYLLYNDRNTYEILSADSNGIATTLGDSLAGETGDKIKLQGYEAKIMVRGVRLNVTPIKDTLETTTVLTDKPAATKPFIQLKDGAPAGGKPEAVADSTKAKDSAGACITILTAANFDFTGKLSTSYLGLFNVFAPNIAHSKFGFNFGIERINYSTASINGNDSSQTEYFAQNFLLNPLDVNRQLNTINAGAKYLQQYNQYTFNASNTVWSFYLDPVWKLLSLNPRDARMGLYAHVHGELLINQFTKTANVKKLYQNPDTLTAGNIMSDNGFYWVAKNPIVANYNFISAYFGVGATLFTNLYDDKSQFFCQGTIGFANHTPDFTKLNDPTILLNANGTFPVDDILSAKTKAFYLLRTNFIQNLSAKSQLVVGFLVRGNFTDLNCQYAAFLGLNLDVQAIAKLITGN
jgi:hypothetical protein